MKDILFRETSTLGIRQVLVDRFRLPRTSQQVVTPYGKVRVKLGQHGSQIKVSPEYEDCQNLAREKQVPFQIIYQAAIAAFQKPE